MALAARGERRTVLDETIREHRGKDGAHSAQDVSASDRDVLRNLERDLKLVIFGQDDAIDALASAIKMSRSGLGTKQRPVGSFLFSGPTGVGKTEVTGSSR